MTGEVGGLRGHTVVMVAGYHVFPLTPSHTPAPLSEQVPVCHSSVASVVNLGQRSRRVPAPFGG